MSTLRVSVSTLRVNLSTRSENTDAEFEYTEGKHEYTATECEYTETECDTLRVNHCSFSRDGQFLLTGSDDCNVCVWNVTEEKLIYKVAGHTGPVKACAFSTDSTLFASGSCDCTVRVWDMKTGNCLHVLEAANTVEAIESEILKDAAPLRITKKRKLGKNKGKNDYDGIATGSWDYTVRVWSLRTMKQKIVLQGHKGNVSCVAFSAIGMLASGSWDKTVRVWDSRNGRLIFLLEEHTDRVMALSFSLDSILLVTAAGDETSAW
ncbi:WD repeat-containing protein 38 [Mustelus asterias]